jgi:predicted nucleotidyltransferase
MIDSEKINMIVQVIVSEHDPVKVLLFGSCASGMINMDSDIDMIIVKPSDKPRYQRGIEIRKSLIGTGVPLDLIVYTPEEFDQDKNTRFTFLSSALKNSKVLYEKQG